jgi:hypothetical protein
VTRGIVLGLTPAQVASRAKYLGNVASAWDLDDHVREPTPKIVDGYYLLEGHNGGKDPTARDPWDRWHKDGGAFENRTADCIGGASWCGGFDRYQPERFPLYDGWINTNSMIEDALGKATCFELLDRPAIGCFMVAPTGAPGVFTHCGHISTVYSAPEEWDHDNFDCWRHVLAVDVAARTPSPANARTSGAVWFGARKSANATHYTCFVRSIMKP